MRTELVGFGLKKKKKDSCVEPGIPMQQMKPKRKCDVKLTKCSLRSNSDSNIIYVRNYLKKKMHASVCILVVPGVFTKK